MRKPSFLSLLLTLSLFLALPIETQAAESVKLAWDASPDPKVTGYTIHYGTRSAQYSEKIDAGNQTQYELPPLPDGTYFFAVRAYAADGTTSPFSNEITVSIAGTPAEPRERTRSDFNGDGRADILWSHRTTGQLAAWLLHGTTLRIESGLSHSMPDLNWEVVGTGDFNGDKNVDLVWRHRLYGFLGVWFMKGLTCVGAVSLSTARVADTAWKIVAVGDVTGDGHADILWQHDTGPLAVWRMNGITSVSGAALVGDPAMAHDPLWRVVGVADMNGDAQMDLVWRHAGGWLSAWLMSAGNVFGVASLNPAAEFDTNWRVVGNVDANLDGKQDLLWQHSDGTVVVWFMDGLNRIGMVTVTGGSLGGTNWRVVGPK